MSADRQRIEPIGSLEEARPDWDALAVASGNPFATYEWAAAWWRVYGPGRSLALSRVRRPDGEVAAILPLYRADRGPVRLLRFIGHGAADEHGPVSAAEDSTLAAVGLREAAAALGPRGALLAERLAGDSAVLHGLDGRVLRSEPSPLLAIDGQTWDDWLAGKSSNFRQQVRRGRRKIEREHALTFRLADEATLLGDLETLFRLHDARWEDEGGSDAFDEDRRDFHRDFAARALARGWLRLWVAEVDGEPGAAWYGLRFAGHDWYYQMGRDPAWERLKLGFVLLNHTIQDAFACGVQSYRFGLGGESYKDRFASADHGLETVVAGSPAVTRLIALAASSARRLPGSARRRIAA